MRKPLAIGLLVVLVGGAATYFGLVRRERTAAAAGAQVGPGQSSPGPAGERRQGQGGSAGGVRGLGGGGFRPPMTVEVVRVARGTVEAHLTAVGNLIGQATVDVVPQTGGRLVSVGVQLGDPVRRGQVIAKIEDREIVEQVRQAEASHQVALATIRQREADLSLAQTSVERSRNLYNRQLLPKQTLEDAEARYAAGIAQLDLSRAQLAQSDARLEELRINLGNTTVISPVDGFVGRRNVDPGAWVSQNAPVVSVVDISSLRLVANVVEKDLRLVNVGDPAAVEVDAYPGERFSGRIARVAPILDPATRTAVMEVAIPNRDNRLKPGMYAKVNLTVESRQNVLVIPKISLVDSEGQRGVFLPTDDHRAEFRAVTVGIEESERVEIVEGLQEGEQIVSVGAGALRRSDQLQIAGTAATPGGKRGEGRRPAGGGEGRMNDGLRPPQSKRLRQQRPIA